MAGGPRSLTASGIMGNGPEVGRRGREPESGAEAAGAKTCQGSPTAMRFTSIPQYARNANRVGEIAATLGKYGLADWIHRLGLDFAKGWLRSTQGQGLGDLSFETRLRLVLTDL